MTPGGDLTRAVVSALPATAGSLLPRSVSARLPGRTFGPLSRRAWSPGRDGRAERHPGPLACPARAAAAPTRPHVLVAGGGVAGVAAAVGLAERGVDVTLVEAGRRLGGRVASWTVDVDGSAESMSRGFHAFFRQYYTLRSLLRRVDPGLSMLRPIEDYPLQHADGTRDSFTSIPRVPPLNLLGFVARSPSFRTCDLPRIDVERALALLDVRFPGTFAQYDGRSAQDVLDALRFPPAMRHLALEVFARSFFADPSDFSGGELVAMFHTYFLGSAEGLLFDVTATDFDTAWWEPLRRYLTGLGAHVVVDTAVVGLDPGSDEDSPVTVGLSDGSTLRADGVVLATHRPALQDIVTASPNLADPTWRDAVRSARMAPRFVVQRLWLDRPVAPGTPPFLGTAALGRLDNLSAVHLVEAGAAAWARRTGGSVMEMHAYAVPDNVADEDIRSDLLTRLRQLHPELEGARTVHEEWLVHADCPLVGTDPWRARPGVRTPHPRVALAGDGVRCDLPVALMERAATTGFHAANVLLEQWGRTGHDTWSVPTTPRLGPAVPAARHLAARYTGSHRGRDRS